MMSAKRKTPEPKGPSSPRGKLDKHDMRGIALQVGFQVAVLILIVVGQFMVKQLNDQINGEDTIVGGAIVSICTAGFCVLSRVWRDNTR